MAVNPVVRISVAASVAALVVVAFVVGRWGREPGSDSVAAPPPTIDPATVVTEAHPAFLYGRITTVDGDRYEGRLRWGGDEEAFWGDYFNGFKVDNPWAAHVSPERLTEPDPIKILGVEVASRERKVDLRRPFMSRFGDIARVEARGADLRVTLKSGTVFLLDRFAADDLADGVRVWDPGHGVVDLDEGRIRAVELLPTPGPGAVPGRLHGTVQTRHNEFTGFIQWNRRACLGADELRGHGPDGETSLRFDGIRSIARDSSDSARVTLLDGREFVLSGTREAGDGHRGVFVDDRRYGRVLVPWDAFVNVEFRPGGSGPAYDDFSPGRPLTGTVLTRSGDRLAGRLVFDLDESETTETLDAPSQGVDYTIPFGRVAAIVPPCGDRAGAPRASVILHGGEQLALECSGDLGEGNAGMLIFLDRSERPEYVPWVDVEQVDLDR